MKVLAGDLGGTKTLLCLAECHAGAVETIHERRYNTADWSGLAAMLADFLAHPVPEGAIEAGCIVVAGPVTQVAAGHWQSRITNVPWLIDSRELAESLNLGRFRLLNDFEGIGYGLSGLHASELVTLQEAPAQTGGPRILIGAGTGLGESLLLAQDGYYTVVPREGGHAGFAPEDTQQDALLAWLRKNLPAGERVTWEHLLSGSGLARIYRFLKETGFAKPGAELEAALRNEDPAAAISRFGLARQDPLADETLNLFVRIYGSEAGNLALTGPAGGGVFIAGGIAPKILPRLQDGQFMAAFLNKAPMRHLLESLPVKVVTNERVGLLGAILSACH